MEDARVRLVGQQSALTLTGRRRSSRSLQYYRIPSNSTVYITAVKVGSRVRCLTSSASIGTCYAYHIVLLDVKYSLPPKTMVSQQTDTRESQTGLANRANRAPRWRKPRSSPGRWCKSRTGSRLESRLLLLDVIPRGTVSRFLDCILFFFFSCGPTFPRGARLLQGLSLHPPSVGLSDRPVRAPGHHSAGQIWQPSEPAIRAGVEGDPVDPRAVPPLPVM